MWPLAAWAFCNLHFISAMKKNMNLIQAKFIMFMCNVHGFLILLCKMPCNINSGCNACTFVHFFFIRPLPGYVSLQEVKLHREQPVIKLPVLFVQGPMKPVLLTFVNVTLDISMKVEYASQVSHTRFVYM